MRPISNILMLGVALLSFAACSRRASTVTCGPGTTLVGSECVAVTNATRSPVAEPSEPSALRAPPKSAGSIDPKLAPLVAEIDQLEVKFNEAVAALMRARQESEAACADWQSCVDAVPSGTDLPPGEYASRVRLCAPKKTDACKKADAAASSAVRTSNAATADLRAAKKRLEIARRGVGK